MLQKECHTDIRAWNLPRIRWSISSGKKIIEKRVLWRPLQYAVWKGLKIIETKRLSVVVVDWLSSANEKITNKSFLFHISCRPMLLLSVLLHLFTSFEICKFLTLVADYVVINKLLLWENAKHRSRLLLRSQFRPMPIMVTKLLKKLTQSVENVEERNRNLRKSISNSTVDENIMN